ncbi:hypothetical protein [Nocardia sp. NPDC024068]|uniref:hypothetical protein n=1 Tax=Nocardia sp. NPDC024068 TaxID=3157197 RepID=UPI0033F50B55
MSSQRAPWSRSPGRTGPVAQFGSLDPAVIRAATGRRSVPPPAEPAGAGESAGGAGPDGEADATVSAHLLGSAVSVDPGHSGASVATLPTIPMATPVPARAESGPVDASPAGHTGTADSAPAARYAGHPSDEHPPAGAHPGQGPFGGHALLGLCLGLAVLLAAGSFYLGRTTGPDEAGRPGLATVASAPTATVQAVPAPSKSTSPGSGSRDVGSGFVFGKVRGNDGGTLTISSELTRSEITVYTDRDTKLYVLMASRVEGITIGAPVVVYGRRHADGTITADTITGLSLQA